MDARQRDQVVAEVAGGSFDIVIIGGGINGAGAALDASARGLKVLLLEQRDLAFGTSSRSSKLIHGGLRYLEHYEFRLVFEGTNERAVLRKVAPHLVRPLMFALPVYEETRHPLWLIDVGLWMYDGLSLFKTEKRHVTLRSPKRMLEREPLLNPEGLTGGIIYYDCITDDARLTLENAIGAAERGAIVLTRARVSQVEQAGEDSEVKVGFVDELSGKQVQVSAKAVINATGVWTDRIRGLVGDSNVIRPTKGVHLVLKHDRLAVNHAAALAAPQDGRVFFAIPWNGRTVIGTTDTDEKGDPAKLRVEAADVEYLLAAANHAFPTTNLVPADVVSAWVGLRPLVREGDAASASDVSREHTIFRDGRMVSIAGGKLTTYRRIADEIVEAALKVAKIRTKDVDTRRIRLPGAVGLDCDFDVLAERLAADSGVDPEVCVRLANLYGTRAKEILEYVKDDRSLAERLEPEHPIIAAEVIHAVETELALDVSDILIRRTSLQLVSEDQGKMAAGRVADLMAKRLGWSQARRAQSLEEYEQNTRLITAFAEEMGLGARSAS